MTYNIQASLERQEASEYRSGMRVELKQRPGVVHIIAEYDSMMVPPIWLANDPQPRYPEELNVLPNIIPNWFAPGGRSRAKTRNSRHRNSMALEKAVI